MTALPPTSSRPPVDEPRPPARGNSNVLRAMGQLLVALADEGEVDPPVSQLRAAVESMPGEAGTLAARESRGRYEEPSHMTEAPARTRESYTPSSLPREATDDDIHLMLADARARAHQLIDESVVKAHDLLSRRRPATTADLQQQNDQLDRIKRAVAEVGVELRAVHKRLDTIETLLRRRPEPASAPPVAAAAAPASAAAPTEPTEATPATAAPVMAAAPARVESPEAPQPATLAMPWTAAPVQPAAPETPPADPTHGSPTTPVPATASTRPTPPPASMPATPSRAEATPPSALAKPESPARAAEAVKAEAVSPGATAGTTEPKPVEPKGEVAASPWAAATSLPLRPPQARSASLPPHRLPPPASPPRVAASEAVEAPSATIASTAPDAPKPGQLREEPKQAPEVERAQTTAVTSQPVVAAASVVAGAMAASADVKTSSEPTSSKVEHDENTTEAKPAPSWSPALSSVPAAQAPAPKPAADPVRAEVSAGARPRVNGTTALAMPAALATKPATASAPASAPSVPAPAAERSEATAPSAPAATPTAAASPSAVATPKVAESAAPAPAAAPAGIAPSTPPPAAPVHEETFAADGAPVTLRISPISGFQGLMRVQDTIVRLREVREAGVEAYARGEARMRLAIGVPVSPQRIAEALGESLGQDARIVSVSVKEHQLEVALRERPRGARP